MSWEIDEPDGEEKHLRDSIVYWLRRKAFGATYLKGISEAQLLNVALAIETQEYLRVDASSLPKLPYNMIFLTRIKDLGFSSRVKTSMASDGRSFLGDIVVHDEYTLLRVPNFGKTALADVKETLKDMGFHLGQKIPDWYSWKTEAWKKHILSKDVLTEKFYAANSIPEAQCPSVERAPVDDTQKEAGFR